MPWKKLQLSKAFSSHFFIWPAALSFTAFSTYFFSYLAIGAIANIAIRIGMSLKQQDQKADVCTLNRMFALLSGAVMLFGAILITSGRTPSTDLAAAGYSVVSMLTALALALGFQIYHIVSAMSTKKRALLYRTMGKAMGGRANAAYSMVGVIAGQIALLLGYYDLDNKYSWLFAAALSTLAIYAFIIELFFIRRRYLL